MKGGNWRLAIGLHSCGSLRADSLLSRAYSGVRRPARAP
jgi:hypothetical protein